MYRLPSFVLLALVLVSSASAQARRPSINISPPTIRNSNEARLEVQLTTETSRPLETRTMVELSSMTGSTQQGFPDSNGRVSFSVRAGSNYRLEVTGPDVERTSASIEILPNESYHRETVAVKLKSNASPGNSSPGGNGTVSAALLRAPEKARKEFSKGMEFMRSHTWDKARDHFAKAIKEYPNFDWAYNNLAVTEMQMHDAAAARQDFERAVQLNDKNSDATRNLAKLKMAENDFAGAKPLLEKSLASDPNNPDTLMLLAFAQFKMRDWNNALENAEKVHQAEPDRYPFAHLIAAAIRESRGDRAGAEKQYQTYLHEAPDTPEAQLAKNGLQRLSAGK